MELYEEVSLANEKVSIEKVLSLIGMDDPSYAASGAKVDCPFMGVFHPDSGRSFRVYDGESAYCFACSEKWRSVSLYAAATDLSLDDAAVRLLEEIGYKKPTAEERFAAALNEEQPVDTHALEETLKRYCERIDPTWDMHQFDDEVAHKFRQCVELLPHVHTQDETRTWLAAAKKAMARILKREVAA